MALALHQLHTSRVEGAGASRASYGEPRTRWLAPPAAGRPAAGELSPAPLAAPPAPSSICRATLGVERHQVV